MGAGAGAPGRGRVGRVRDASGPGRAGPVTQARECARVRAWPEMQFLGRRGDGGGDGGNSGRGRQREGRRREGNVGGESRVLVRGRDERRDSTLVG